MPRFVFFFNDTATPEIYTLSLHDALPISRPSTTNLSNRLESRDRNSTTTLRVPRSEEHTSELQSRRDLVCRLLLEKKKKRPRSRGFRARRCRGSFPRTSTSR